MIALAVLLGCRVGFLFNFCHMRLCLGVRRFWLCGLNSVHHPQFCVLGLRGFLHHILLLLFHVQCFLLACVACHLIARLPCAHRWKASQTGSLLALAPCLWDGSFIDSIPGSRSRRVGTATECPTHRLRRWCLCGHCIMFFLRRRFASLNALGVCLVQYFNEACRFVCVHLLATRPCGEGCLLCHHHHHHHHHHPRRQGRPGSSVRTRGEALPGRAASDDASWRRTPFSSRMWLRARASSGPRRTRPHAGSVGTELMNGCSAGSSELAKQLPSITRRAPGSYAL